MGGGVETYYGDVFNNINVYKSDVILQKWLKSNFIALPKIILMTKYKAKDNWPEVTRPQNFFADRLIHTRILPKCEKQINETEFGFRNYFRTCEEITYACISFIIKKL